MTGGPPLLTVLVPARNAALLLPEWLDSVAGYADAVIALDDGSTDDTRAILSAHPLVTTVLTNEVRPGYEGWDDRANRQRLVYAALATGAQWLLFLDADEEIDEADGRALRRFLLEEAKPGFAYGMEVFRLVDDGELHDPRSLWVFRLFAAADAETPLPSKRLHFVPVPTGIPLQRWLHTSIRIRHRASLTASHRRARFEKYREADPDNEFQTDYVGLLDDPPTMERWTPRADGLPVLLGREGRYLDRIAALSATDGPVVTAVVIAQDDEEVIETSIAAVLDQRVDEEFEVIVVCSGTDRTAARAAAIAPSVRCVQLPNPVLPGEARNVGLWMARGEYTTYPGSHVRLLPGSLAARLRAHDDGWDMVTGSVVNGNTTRPGWASYFLDHAHQIPSRPSGQLHGPPGHASYVTRHLREIGGFPIDMRAGEDTVVNQLLFRSGKRTYFERNAAFVHASPSSTTAHLLHHHFQRGRGLGRIIRGRSARRASWKQLRSTLPLPRRRLESVRSGITHADTELQARYEDVRELVRSGAVAAATGTWFELLAGRPASSRLEIAIAPPRAGAPLLAIGGRPGEAPTGLLGYGTPEHAARHLGALAAYARTVCDVRPALAPIVTSATSTAERFGSHTLDLHRDVVDSYVQVAAAMGAVTLLQIQPGRASLASIIERWADLLVAGEVGVLFDLRPDVARADQHLELHDAAASLQMIGAEIPMLVRADCRSRESFDAGTRAVVVDPTDPRTQLPHVALAGDDRPDALVYQ